jgi:TRAP-type C4-dicarboxylate transport system permease large subunit
VPLVVAQGFDPIWFGILMIVLIEMALITPPVAHPHRLRHRSRPATL